MYGMECSSDYLKKMMRKEMHDRYLKECATEKENQLWVDDLIRREKRAKTIKLIFNLFFMWLPKRYKKRSK